MPAAVVSTSTGAADLLESARSLSYAPLKPPSSISARPSWEER